MADTEEGITEDTMEDSLAAFAEGLFSTEHRDLEPDFLQVTGWMVITIPIRTMACAKDGPQPGAIIRKADRTPIPASGIRFSCRTGTGKKFPAIKSDSLVIKDREPV